MPQNFENTLGAIEDLLVAVGAEKRGEANTEAGGHQGGTTHPVKDVDDRTQDATEGARSSENESDVKSDQGSPGVNSAAEVSGQDQVQLDIGVTTKATGEDPSNEDDYKDTKDDSESSHPAKTDNNSLDGMKYSADHAEFKTLFDDAAKCAEEYLAAVAVGTDGEAQKRAQEQLQQTGQDSQDAGGKEAPASGSKTAESSEKPPKTGDGSSDGKEAAAKDGGSGDSSKVEKTGYDIAGIFAGSNVPEDDQKAASEAAVSVLADILEMADRRAEKTARFYDQLNANAQKQAEGEEEDDGGGGEEPPANPPEGGSEEIPAGDAAAAEAPGAGGEPSEDEILSLLAGGEDMGAEEAMGGMADAGGGAAMPPEAAGAAVPGAEAGGMGGGMGGEMGGGMGGEMGGEPGMDDAQMLQMLMEELGVTPEELLAAAGPKVAEQIVQKIAEAEKPKRQPKTAGEKKRYEQIKTALQELLNRS